MDVKKKQQPKKIGKEVLAKAKDLYMEYTSVIQIGKAVNVSRNTIQNYVNDYWKAERNLNRSELFHELSQAKKAHIMSLNQSAIVVISRALADLAKRDTPPSVKDAQLVATILESLDKILRLDDAKPTEIRAQESVVTVKELKDKMMRDPFTDVADIPVGELITF